MRRVRPSMTATIFSQKSRKIDAHLHGHTRPLKDAMPNQRQGRSLRRAPSWSPRTIGWTLLSYAARYGHEAVVKLLLEKGVDLDSKDISGRTPLSHAARYGHEAVVKLHEKGADNSKIIWPSQNFLVQQ
jgi:hypothetical protein